ncbi:hypothetical protein R3P38DRAFT_2774463 [Favolaschia claudopus]|uniref:CCHC-type domain-containing protein n=1 Tax=Favolaschia claudopus TaxID=2862362 RepID=A0AAW0BZH4_9AGAR
MHISRLLCAPLPEQAAMRGTSNDLQLQPIPVASVDKLAVSKITTVPCDSGDSPFKVVEKASFYFLFRLFPVSTPPVAFALLQESDAQTGTSGCYSVLIPDTYNAVVGVDSGVQLDDSYGDSKSSQEEGSTKTARCGFCKRRGHYSRTCPISLTSTPVCYPAKAKVDLPTCAVQFKEPHVRIVRCTNCRRRGHYYRTCPEPPNTKPNTPRVSWRGRGRCSICRGEGHNRTSCPNRRSRRESQPDKADESDFKKSN